MTDLVAMFGASFMQRALLAVILIATVAAVVGVALNLRELEFVSDGIVHAVFPGVVIGFLAASYDGIYLGAIIAALVATVLLTLAAHRGVGEDATTAVLLSGSFALGVVLISRSTSYATGLEHLLFGQLLTIRTGDLVAIAILGSAALATVLLTWKQQLFISFDPAGAQAAGLSLLAYKLALNLSIAAVVVAASRAVGNLLVLAMLIVPAAIGRLVSRRLQVIVPVAIASSVLVATAGLICGYWLSVDARLTISPSAVLVLMLVAVYLIVAAISTTTTRVKLVKQRAQRQARAEAVAT